MNKASTEDVISGLIALFVVYVAPWLMLFFILESLI
jgi:hypothetical protein